MQHRQIERPLIKPNPTTSCCDLVVTICDFPLPTQYSRSHCQLSPPESGPSFRLSYTLSPCLPPQHEPPQRHPRQYRFRCELRSSLFSPRTLFHVFHISAAPRKPCRAKPRKTVARQAGPRLGGRGDERALGEVSLRNSGYSLNGPHQNASAARARANARPQAPRSGAEGIAPRTFRHRPKRKEKGVTRKTHLQSLNTANQLLTFFGEKLRG